MKAIAETPRPANKAAWAWYLLLLLLPIVTALTLLSLRHQAAARLAQRKIDNYGVVPNFELTNQNNERFGLANLKGKIWIADFVYTNCPGPCPMITSRMSELQKPLEKTDVHLVSFTVDPETDTPEVLRAYAEKWNAQPQRWEFLTGPRALIHDLSRDGFKMAASDASGEHGMLVHSTRLILVDRRGVIRGYYDAAAADAITKLLADTNHLLREQPR